MTLSETKKPSSFIHTLLFIAYFISNNLKATLPEEYEIKELSELLNLNNKAFKYFHENLGDVEQTELIEILHSCTNDLSTTGIPPYLQTTIKETQERPHTSWLTDSHATSYLADRSALPDINYTLALTEQANSYYRLAEIAMNLVWLYNTGFTESHKYYQFPTDRIFYTRTPNVNLDQIVTPLKGNSSQYITVIRKGYFYHIEVVHENCYCPPKLLQQLFQEIHEKHRDESDVDISGIALVDRERSNKLYNKLVSNDQNKVNIDKLNQSLLTITLDDDYTELEKQLHRMQTGLCGSCWHLKSIQIFHAQKSVRQQGLIGFTFEHSQVDGAVMLEVIKTAVLPEQASLKELEIKKEMMEWVLDDETKKDIQEAATISDHSSNSYSLQLVVITLPCPFDTINTKLNSIVKPSKQGNYIDGFLQHSMACATRSTFGDFVKTYESVDMSHKKGGRTEVARPLTKAMRTSAQHYFDK